MLTVGDVCRLLLILGSCSSCKAGIELLYERAPDALDGQRVINAYLKRQSYGIPSA